MSQGADSVRLRKTVIQALEATCLAPAATHADFEALCRDALALGVPRVCVPSKHVGTCMHWLKQNQPETTLAIVSVVGFPTGAVLSEVKAFEAAQAVQSGASEIDMVVDLCALREGNKEDVQRDIKAVVRAVSGAPVKVILETCELDQAQKIWGAQWAMEAGARWVKTSTGFSKKGATVEDIRLLREVVGPKFGVKASGGIRTWQDACAMIDAGADRLGASGIKEILVSEEEMVMLRA